MCMVEGLTITHDICGSMKFCTVLHSLIIKITYDYKEMINASALAWKRGDRWGDGSTSAQVLFSDLNSGPHPCQAGTLPTTWATPPLQVLFGKENLQRWWVAAQARAHCSLQTGGRWKSTRKIAERDNSFVVSWYWVPRESEVWEGH
jgi:hypothetical protein